VCAVSRLPRDDSGGARLKHGDHLLVALVLVAHVDVVMRQPVVSLEHEEEPDDEEVQFFKYDGCEGVGLIGVCGIEGVGLIGVRLIERVGLIGISAIEHTAHSIHHTHSTHHTVVLYVFGSVGEQLSGHLSPMLGGLEVVRDVVAVVETHSVVVCVDAGYAIAVVVVGTGGVDECVLGPVTSHHAEPMQEGGNIHITI